MAQVAQQDHLYIETPSSFDTALSWPLSFFEQLEEKQKAGVLLDVVLTYGGDRAKILTYSIVDGKLSDVSFVAYDGLMVLTRPE